MNSVATCVQNTSLFICIALYSIHKLPQNISMPATRWTLDSTFLGPAASNINTSISIIYAYIFFIVFLI